MWMFMDFLAHPFRSLRTWVVVGAVVIVLLLALANAGSVTLTRLGTVIGIMVMAGIFVRIPMRLVMRGIVAAIVIAAVISLVREVMASGVVPLIVGGVIVVVAVGALGRSGVLHRAPRSRGAHWASLAELRRAGFLGPHGYPLGVVESHVVRLPPDREREGVLVTAATGAGKTSIVVIPALIEETTLPAGDRRSQIILDPKDEVTQDTMPTLAKTHRVLLLDPSRPDECTVGLDPLASLPGPNDEGFVGAVKQLAQSWFWMTRNGQQTTDPFWINMPRALMEALFLAFVVRFPKGTFVELADWTRTLTVEKFQTVLDSTPHQSVRASAETLRSLGMSEKTIGPIWSDVLQRFDVLEDPRVRRAMAGPPVDVEAFVANPTVLYLRVGAQDAQRLAPLLTMALNQMYGELTKIAARHKRNRLPRDVRVIVDEFGTLPRILGLEIALATLRSMGVGHLMLVQTSAQIVHAYGRDLAATIQDNLGTKLILNGAAADDAKLFSARCGEITEYHRSNSWSGGGLFRAPNVSYTAERRPLVPPAEIIHGQGQVLVSTRGLSPIRLTARRYYMVPSVLKQLEEDQRQFDEQRHRAVSPTPPDGAGEQVDTERDQPSQPSRDVPPAGCSKEEWDAAAKSLLVARLSLEDDLFDLVTGRAGDLDQVRARWRANPSRSSPARYARITGVERAKSPNVAKYVDELALRLELRHEENAP